MVIIYKMTWKLCRMLKLHQIVDVCFPFISYKFQHQLSSLRTVVTIRVNGVRDICSVFHRVFFSCVNMTDFEQHAVIKFLSKENKTNVEIENTLFKVWGDAAYKRSTVQKWTKRFCEGKEFDSRQKVNYAKLHLPIFNGVTQSGWNAGTLCQCQWRIFWRRPLALL